MAPRGPEVVETSQIAIVEVASGATRVVAGERSADVAARWLPDGSLLFVSDADGWFQVVRLTADGHDRIVLTAGEREHGSRAAASGTTRSRRPTAGVSSTSRCTTGCRTCWSASSPPRPPRSAAGADHRRRRGPSRPPRPEAGSTHGMASGAPSGGCPTARGSRRSVRARRRPRTSGCSRCPASPRPAPGHVRSPIRCRPCSAPRSRRRGSRPRSGSWSPRATACAWRARSGAH